MMHKYGAHFIIAIQLKGRLLNKDKKWIELFSKWILFIDD